MNSCSCDLLPRIYINKDRGRIVMFLSRVQLFIATKMLNIVLPVLILFGLFQFGKGNLIDCIIYRSESVV